MDTLGCSKYPTCEHKENLNPDDYVRRSDGEAEQDGICAFIGESGEDYLYPRDYLIVLKWRNVARALSQTS